MASPLAPFQQHPSGFTGTLVIQGVQLPSTSLCAHNFPLPRLLSSLLAGITPVHSSNLRSGVTLPETSWPLHLGKIHRAVCAQVNVGQTTSLLTCKCSPASPNSLVCKLGLKTSCDHVAGLCQLICAKHLTHDLMLSKFSTNDCHVSY